MSEILLSDAEKRDRILIRSLPKTNTLKKLILAGDFTRKEIDEMYKAFSIAIATDRKLISNSFSVAITLKTSKREIKQISRELIRRYMTRKKYTKVQRAYFESCLIHGWGEIKEKRAIAGEIVAMLRYFDSDDLKKQDYYQGGIQLNALITKIHRNKEQYENILFKVYQQVYENQVLTALLKGIVSKAQFNIKSVNVLVNIIKKGKQRPYLPKLGKTKK
ncbi:hypothetical protein ACOTVS_11985 [Aliarcobacter butzleri]|uniref:hypothetical protein n=1 Tax=Aliarcobacter butzleri TaxID=28197 RepID=UPI00344D8434